MFYYNRRYTATLPGAIWKPVCCENCDCEFVYKMVRTAQGVGNSLYGLDNAGAKRRAQAGLEEQLTNLLERGFDVVPCPNCGCYQEYMLPKLRSQYKNWMLWLGITAILLTPFAACMVVALASPSAQRDGVPIPVAVLMGMSVGLLGVFGPGLLIVRAILRMRYDPNQDDDVELRKQEGLDRSLFRDEFEQEMAKKRQDDEERERRRRERRRQHYDDYDS